MTVDSVDLIVAATTLSGNVTTTNFINSSGVSSLTVPVDTTFAVLDGGSFSNSGTLTLSISGTLDAIPLSTISGTTFSLASGATFINSSTLSVASGSTATFSSGSTVSNLISSLSNAGTLNIYNGFGTITDLSISAGTVTVYSYTTSSLLSLDDLVMTGGTLTSGANTGDTQDNIVGVSANTVTVNAGASINVDSKGHAGGNGTHINGYGPGGGVGQASGGYAGGGGHGGAGGGSASNAGGAAYCSSLPVTTMGSGGGRASSVNGKAGGGLIYMIVSGTMTVNGTLTADGETAGTSAYPGRGGGGGIQLIVGTFAGTPTSFTATGGAGTGASNGKAGGGCVGIIYRDAISIDTTSSDVTKSTSGYATGGAADGYELFSQVGVIVTESAASTDVGEAGTTDSYTIELLTAPSSNVTITLLTIGDQISLSTSTIVFTSANWNIPVTVTTTAINDDIEEGPDTQIITHTAVSSDVSYNGIVINDVTVNITDNDTAAVSVGAISGNTTEAGATSTFTVVLTSEPTDTVTMSVTSTDATEGITDIELLTFTALNWDTPQTVTVTGVDDILDDGDIIYSIGLGLVVSNDVFYDSINPDDVTVTNIDDDPLPGITVSVVSGNTSEASVTSTFTVVLQAQPTDTVTISVTSTDATEGTADTELLTFTALNWDTPQTVTVTGVDDDIDDGNIDYTITLGVAVSNDGDYNGLNPSDVSATNIDDDVAGITVGALSGNTTEAAATSTFTVVLDTQPTADVTIVVGTSDATEGTASTALLTFSSGNWSTPQTVIVTGVDDDIDDGDIVYTITLAAAASADGNYNTLDAADVSVTNTDNDTAGITVSAISGNTAEAGGTATFTVVLDSEPTDTVTMSVTSTDATEGTVSTALLTFTTLNWDTPQIVTVTGVDDIGVDGDVDYTITLGVAVSNDGNYNGINPADVSLTNTDDDVAEEENNDNNEGNGGPSFFIAPPIQHSIKKVLGYELLVNEGSVRTQKRDVSVDVYVADGLQMAISLDPTFASSIYTPFISHTRFVLPQEEETYTVYVRVLGQFGRTDTFSAPITYKKSDLAKDCPVEVHSAYKQPNDSGVWYIDDACTKSAFKNPQIFFSWFYSFADVQTTSEDILDSIETNTLGFMPYGPRYIPQDGELVKRIDSPYVYYILGNKKYVIATEAVFTSFGFDWSWIRDVDAQVVSNYKEGGVLSVPGELPIGAFFKVKNGGPRIYRIDYNASEKKRVYTAIKTIEEFHSYQYREDLLPNIEISDASIVTTGGYTFTRNLSVGENGDDVVQLQQMLQHLGYFPSDVFTSGFYGSVTEQSVMLFQQDHGLPSIGVFGPQTRRVLSSL